MSGPYVVKGKGKGDKGKTNKGKGVSKGGMPIGSEDTEHQQRKQLKEEQQPPSRAGLLERRTYELEGEVGHLRRQLTWLLSGLDRVLVLPADVEEPSSPEVQHIDLGELRK